MPAKTTNIEDLKFSKSHEWVRVEKDIATTGLSDFAVKQLSDLVFVDLPAVTDLLEQGQPFAEVDSVKATSDVYAPLSGEVVEVNDTIGDDLDKVSKDPFGKGWFVKFRLSHPDELENLMDGDAYRAHCKKQS